MEFSSQQHNKFQGLSHYLMKIGSQIIKRQLTIQSKDNYIFYPNNHSINKKLYIAIRSDGLAQTMQPFNTFQQKLD